MNWHEQPLRVFDLALEDSHGQWLDRWTAEEVIRTVREINANVLDMMIVNEWGQAYFNARHLPRHPQLLGADRLVEVLDEARRHGIRVVGMWGPTPNPIVYEHHPDWARRTRDGQIEGWGYRHLDPCVHVCHNSPYGEIVLETLDDLFREYAIDGVAFDYFIRASCYCRFCRDKFRTECQLDLNAREDWGPQQERALSDWATRDAEAFVTRATEVAHKHGRVLVGGARTSDVLFAEPHTGGMITLRDKGFCIRETTARARVEQVPTVICTPYSHLYYVGLPKPPAHMRQEFREIVIHGASPWPVIWDWEWVKDKRGLAALGQVFGEVKDHQAYLSDRESLKHAALLVSKQTAALFDGEEYRHSDPVKGWYDALTRAHIPVDLILDEEVAPQILSSYRVLILANAASLSDRQVEAIEGFVAAGGGLVASHRTSLFDAEGYHRRGFALKEVLGCDFQAVIDAPWTYVGFSRRHPISQGFDRDFLLMHGEMPSLEAYHQPEKGADKLRGITLDARQQLKVAPLAGGQVVGTIFDSAKPLGSYFIKDLAPAQPGKDTGYPAIITKAHGAGRAVYLPGQVDRLFYRIGHPDYERLLLNCLEYAGGRPALQLTGPTTVEATYYQQPQHSRIIVHLLNHTYDQLFPTPTTGAYGSFSRDVFRPVSEVIPVSNIQLTLAQPDRGRVARVYSLCSSRELPFRPRGDAVRVRVPRLEEYEAIVVQSG